MRRTIAVMDDAADGLSCSTEVSTVAASRQNAALFLSAGGHLVTSEFAEAARKLVAGDSSIHVAASAVQACEQLSQHLARLVGEAGIHALLARSVALASARSPWLANTIPRAASTESPWAALRTAMERQDPHTAREAFIDLLATLVALLGRLIGGDLVARLLHEVWPELFPYPAKEPT